MDVLRALVRYITRGALELVVEVAKEMIWVYLQDGLMNY